MGRWPDGKRADATAGYTIFAPTGRYADGANNNTGLGMWGQEFSVGTTVYLTEPRQWHAATLATFDFQSKKEDSETKVGNVMNLEGGLGGDDSRYVSHEASQPFQTVSLGAKSFDRRVSQ